MPDERFSDWTIGLAPGTAGGGQLIPAVYGPGDTRQLTLAQVALLAASVLRPPYMPGNWYPALQITAAAGAAINSSTNARLIPLVVTQTMTIDKLGAQVTTASVGGNFQLAIFANDPALNLPTGLPIAYTAPTLSTGVSIASVTGALNVNPQLDPLLLYWLAIAVDNTTAVFGAWSSATNAVPFLMGAPALTDYQGNAGQQSQHYNVPHVFAADLSTLNINPANVTIQGGTVVRAALVHFRVVSVP